MIAKYTKNKISSLMSSAISVHTVETFIREYYWILPALLLVLCHKKRHSPPNFKYLRLFWKPLTYINSVRIWDELFSLLSDIYNLIIGPTKYINVEVPNTNMAVRSLPEQIYNRYRQGNCYNLVCLYLPTCWLDADKTSHCFTGE